MLLSPASAEALASIILRSTQGEVRVRLQLPWIVEDRDDCWLVRGTPFHDRQHKLTHCQFSIFIRKTSAEVIGLRFDVRLEYDEAQDAELKAEVPEEGFRGIFGPVVGFAPDTTNLDVCGALYGGLVNTPDDAIDFAYALAQDTATIAPFAKSTYEAAERSGTWHVTCRDRRGIDPVHLCSFSRETGKVTSGVLLHQP